jgi:NADPH:quinone reductase-like Zn-dependent oxidoreductase
MLGVTPTFPYVLGTDGAGTVAAVGKQVKGFKEGDRVYGAVLGNPKGGFYAEYASVKGEYVSHIPDKLSIEQAGVMLSDAVTGLRGLDDIIGLKRDESVMIFGASGGIGHMAVQLAKRMGARVFAVASGDDGVSLVKRLGADAVVDGHRDDVAAAARRFTPNGVDTALILAGGEAADRALTAVRDGGRVAHPNGVEPVPKARHGVKVSAYDGEPDREIIDKLNRLIEAGPFEVHIARTFPLEQAADAHRALDQHYLGKLALRPRQQQP